VIFHLYFDETWSQEGREAFLQAVLHGLDQGDQAMRKGQVDALLEAYAQATGLIDRMVRIEEDQRVLQGRIVEIDKKGDLVIKPDKGRTAKAAGKKVKAIEYLDVARN
jgi:biotin-(acetyl-CoA carboxylase) ligase